MGADKRNQKLMNAILEHFNGNIIKNPLCPDYRSMFSHRNMYTLKVKYHEFLGQKIPCDEYLITSLTNNGQHEVISKWRHFVIPDRKGDRISTSDYHAYYINCATAK